MVLNCRCYPKNKTGITSGCVYIRLRPELRRQDGGGSGGGSVAVVDVAVAQSLEGCGRGVR